jgi:hypothetical protein
MPPPPSPENKSSVSAAGQGIDLDTAVAVLRRDFGKALGARVRALTHEVTCDLERVTLRVHYPSFRDGECTLQDLVDVISLYLAPFALPRSEIQEVHEEYGKISADDYAVLQVELHNRAVELFKKAQVSTNRNGEAGELLLCLLTEWILDAPQLIAKMSLKTNPEMPVHGSDGVHVRFCKDTGRLLLFWGESKLYSKLSEAVASAAESIKSALLPSKTKHELTLVKRYISFSGLEPDALKAIKAHLNPFAEASNKRANVTTCLIGFDFVGYAVDSSADPEDVEDAFRSEVVTNLPNWAGNIGKTFMEHGLSRQTIEIFLFPLPSIADFRKLFQQKIGWNPEKKVVSGQ